MRGCHLVLLVVLDVLVVLVVAAAVCCSACCHMSHQYDTRASCHTRASCNIL